MRQLKITKQVTNRETASLDKYLQEIGKVDLITAEEEVELAQKIKAGDERALDKLTQANLRFVVSVAKQYQNQTPLCLRSASVAAASGTFLPIKP
jgi:RNA polymerase primary sigma factor